MLVEIYRHVRPGLTLMDGVWAMEGQGPSNGTLRRLGLVLAADDALAADAVLTKLLGVAPEAHPMLREALALGLPAADLAHIELLGEPLAAVAVSDFRLPDPGGIEAAPHGVWRYLARPFETRPRVAAARCIACAACQRLCPAGAIQIEAVPDGKAHAVIDDAKCIRCYCCNEEALR